MAMIEAYRIGVELVLGGNLAAGVEALLPGLSRLDGSLSHANTEAKALATALGSVAATASGVGQAAGAMERLNAALTAMNRAAAQPSGALAAPAIPRVTPPAGTGKTLPHIAEAPSPQTPVTASQVGSRDAAWQPSPAVTVQSLVQAVAPVRSVEAASPMRAAARIPVIRPPEVIPAQAGAIVRPAMSSVTAAPQLSDPRGPTQAAGPIRPSVAARPDFAPALLALTMPKPRPPEVTPSDGGRMTARQQAMAVRTLVLPRPDAVARVGQPALRALEARRDRPAPVATVPPVGVVRSAVPDRGPVDQTSGAPKAEPKTAWPRVAASFVEAKKVPAMRDYARLLQPGASGMAGPSPGWLPRDPMGQAAYAPAPTAKPRRPSDPDRAAPSPPVRRPVQAGLPDAPSYHPQGSQGGAVIQHVTVLQLDERTIARAVTRQQLRMMGGQVSGTLRPDPSIAPQYGAHLLEL